MTSPSNLAAFDMDGTLIQGRLVFTLANRFDLSEKVRSIQSTPQIAGHEQTKAIAALFAGLTTKDLESAIESIPITKNSENTIAALKERDYKIGIISDSYTIAAGFVANRLNLDFVMANNLDILNGRITGKVDMPLGWDRINCFCKISVCKRYHLEKCAHQLGIPIGNTLAVGDTKSDICMIQRAGVGIAFMPKDEEIKRASNNVVIEPDLLKVLEFCQ
ncbi:MAG TPA: HAD-IB family phosphatase [Nitrososphaera sp.]|jgi:phosphoserine phosphatase|nr:HAD-IB family phosphatase [Nitrososphaera sp.]